MNKSNAHLAFPEDEHWIYPIETSLSQAFTSRLKTPKFTVNAWDTLSCGNFGGKEHWLFEPVMCFERSSLLKTKRLGLTSTYTGESG
ncbi:MAG: hypothetical protein QOH25_3141 [Acidobacteriota bacterium]|nr:hypothetical protein [Acidobacteriota bacterium]